MGMNEKLVISSTATGQRQIADHFRRLIRSGKLAAGSKLPTQKELERQLGVSGTTVHFAFQELIREGLLVGRRACGTFVTENRPGLRQVGLYYPGDSLTHPDHHYLRAVHAALLGECQARELTATVFHDSRPESEDVTPPADLVAAVAARQVDALIAPSAGLPTLARLGNVDIPVAYQSSASIATSVSFDYIQFVDLSLAEVRAAGCRSVGLISPLATQVRHNPFPGVHANVAFTRHFLDRTGDLGLDIRDGWIREPQDDADELTARQVSQEEYGYEQARALLAQPELPDGLIVYTDALARGVVTALLAAGERGAHMTLVLHKNAEVPLICPLPARFIVSSAADVARELLAMVGRQFDGQPPGGPVRVPFQVA